MANQLYEDKHAARLEELCEDYYMPDARAELKKEFPELRKTLKTDAQGHSLLRRWRKKKKSVPQLNSSELLRLAVDMRNGEGLTIDAIFERLKREFPGSTIPSKSKLKSHLKKSKNGTGKTELQMKFLDGTEVIIRVPENRKPKLMKLVRELVGGE